MKRRDVDRIINAKYQVYAEQVIERLKGLPGDVWVHFAADIQRGESFLFEEADRLVEQVCMEHMRSCSSPELELLWFGSDSHWDHDDDTPSSDTEWAEGVLKELHQRVINAAGNEDLDEDEDDEEEAEESGSLFADEEAKESGIHFDDDDVIFLSEVAQTLARLVTQPSLAPEESKAVRRAIAALKRLPDLTPEINVQIEVAHRVSQEGFSESCICTINLDPGQIEISSGGSQCDPAVGSDSYSSESFEWYASGKVARKGDADMWLDRLAYVLSCDNTVYVTDESDDGCPEFG